jgi:hypothetical protein
MPRMIIEHEPWCAVHDDGLGQELCATKIQDFGPVDETDPDGLGVGYVYASRAEEDEAPVVFVFYPTDPPVSDSIMSPGAVRQLVAGLEHDPQLVLIALRELVRDLDEEGPIAKEEA